MSFLFVVCQNGAETPLKDEIARKYPKFRFAFSRPGFVTFKIPADVRRDRRFELKSVFARTWGHSLGKVVGNHGEQLASEFWTVIRDRFPDDVLARFSDLHVFQRDGYLPGDHDFEPGPTPLSDEIAGLIAQAAPDCLSGIRVNQPCQLSSSTTEQQEARVLDCVIVEPNEWWFGWHRATDFASMCPGGVPDLEIPDNCVSRTYLKMAESLAWDYLPIQSRDAVVEIGSSPGGSCQALLQKGLAVTGIDPAEMHEELTGHPYFTHLRARAKDLKRKMFSDFRWLASDASVAPNYTLDTVEAIVTNSSVSIEGLLLTLKLPNWALAKEIGSYHKRIRSWGYPFVKSRQLAFNRREICVFAKRI